jgi:hypothetical protein
MQALQIAKNNLQIAMRKRTYFCFLSSFYCLSLLGVVRINGHIKLSVLVIDITQMVTALALNAHYLVGGN